MRRHEDGLIVWRRLVVATITVFCLAVLSLASAKRAVQGAATGVGFASVASVPPLHSRWGMPYRWRGIIPAAAGDE
jgi:hypothetical protein